MNEKEIIIAAIASLRPTGWSLVGYNLEDIVYDEGIKPITKTELNAEMKVIESKLKAKAEAKETAKAAILDRIGLTVDELKTILG